MGSIFSLNESMIHIVAPLLPYKRDGVTDSFTMYGIRKSSEYTQKIDVLDLLINIIRDHEEKLDELVEGLELVAICLDKAHCLDGLDKIERLPGPS